LDASQTSELARESFKLACFVHLRLQELKGHTRSLSISAKIDSCAHIKAHGDDGRCWEPDGADGRIRLEKHVGVSEEEEASIGNPNRSRSSI
jgi:hypothetical protein